MTAFTWRAADRWVSGVSAVPPAATSVVLNWTEDPAHDGSRLPWAAPGYPALLLYGIGFGLVTDANAATRRLQLDIAGGAGVGTTNWASSGSQTAGLTRRWEIAQGFALETTLAGALTYREPLGWGFLLLPGTVGGAPTTLTISVNAVQAGDQIGSVTIRGLLLLPS